MEGTKEKEIDTYWRSKKKSQRESVIGDKALEDGWIWTGGNEGGRLKKWNPSTGMRQIY